MRRVVRWMLAALAVAACSSSSGSKEGPSAEQAATDVAKALCAKYSACSAYLVAAQFGDMATCASTVKASVVNTLGAPGTGQTPGNAEACATKVAGISCDDAFGHNLPSECQPAAGTLANGTACGDSSQCKSGYCNIAPTSTCGMCAAAPAAGASCMQDADCPPGSTCNASGACVVFGRAGAQCDSAQQPCLPTLTCKNGSCATPDALGAACASDPNGASPYGSCDQLAGALCDQSNMCVKVTLVGAGQPCGLLNGALTLCSANGGCVVPQNANSGVCQAAAAAGGSCDPANGPDCAPPGVCTNGACAAPSASACH
ncbi:MAG TPA: hypothetical protein VKU41_03005 [Polyangiaceae bacterium]|nr:hypothetical protein [Polyangiaceae bacterium]